MLSKCITCSSFIYSFMQLLYSHSVCVGLFISILIHKGFFSCVVWVCFLCLCNHIDLLLIFAVSNICRTGDTCLPFPRKSWQLWQVSLSLIFSCRWFRSSIQPPMPWWTTWMFTLSQERPLTSTSNHTRKEQRLLELWGLFLSYLIFVLFVCVSADVLAASPWMLLPVWHSQLRWTLRTT